MMFGFYARTIDEAIVRPFWAIRIWAHRHPVPFRILATIILTSFMIGWPTIAFAAEDSPIQLLPGIAVKDSAGIPIAQYVQLPLDRGNGFDGKLLVTGPLDFLWATHIFIVSWMLWLFDWVISFQWVEWIATPFVLISETMERVFGQINWVSFALPIAGGIGMLYIMLGRIGKGAGEILISVVCACLAVGFLANPVTNITKDGGFLDTAMKYGGQMAVIVVTDDTTQIDADPSETLQTVITGQLADLYVRNPAQVLSFGHTLTGDCEAIYNEKMKGGTEEKAGFLWVPYEGAITIDDVRDDVRACDAEAKSFNENPNFLSVIGMVVVMNGSTSMFFLPVTILLLFMLSVIGGLWSALKTMWHVLIGILPINRSALWRSLADTVIGISSLVFLTVGLAGALKFTSEVVKAIANAGIPLMVQMGFLNMMVIVIVFMLIRAKVSAKRAGRTLAEQLSRMGVRGGKASPKQRMAAAVVGGSLATAAINGVARVQAAKNALPATAVTNNFVTPRALPSADILTSGQSEPPAPEPAAAPPGDGDGPTGTRAPRKPSKGPSLGALVRIARGLPGGVPGVAVAAAKEVGSAAVKKSVTKAVNAGSQALQGASTAPKAVPAPTEPSAPSAPRRIRLSESGAGIVVRPSVDRPSTSPTYRLPASRPAMRLSASQDLRARLAANRSSVR